MKGYYKVPFRQVYCQSLRGWLASIVLSFVVYKLSPPPPAPAMDLAAPVS